MKSFEIEDTNEFMKQLFKLGRYDSFYLYEVRIKSGFDYYINGRINKEYFDSVDDMLIERIAEKSEDEYVCFGRMKDTILSYIGDNRLPLGMKLILMFNSENVEKLIEMHNLKYDKSQVTGLMFNVYLEKGKICVTTGTSLNVFTMDKSLEHVWDETVEKYYIK